MSKRKKKVIFVAVGVVLSCFVLFFIFYFYSKIDEEEFARKCKQYEGRWESDDGTMSLEVHRVSSAHMSFSIERKPGKKIRLMTAYSIGDGYEFSYTVERVGGILYRIHNGGDQKGHIYLEDNQVRIDIPRFEETKHILEYQGELKKRASLPSEKVVHLMPYMNTKQSLPKEVRSYCTALYDSSGKVWRLRALFSEEKEYYKTDIDGISMNTFETECERELGKPIDSHRLPSDNGYHKVYEKGDYRYTITWNEFGVPTEVDCQKKTLPGMKRCGDFLMKGNTVCHYTGNYCGQKEIILPKNTKRIASHAFSIGEYGYSTIGSVENHNPLKIAAGITVEADAFQDCGPMTIQLCDGWKVVPKSAFAHTVSIETASLKKRWVVFLLPNSLERMEEEAFALDNSSEKLQEYWTTLDEEGLQEPVYMSMEGERSKLTYIGDNALWGISIEANKLPQEASYLGKNITIADNEFTPNVEIPNKVSVLKKDTFFVRQNWICIYIGRKLRDIEEGAFRCNSGSIYCDTVEVDPKNPYIGFDSCGWLMSNDRKVLYMLDSAMDYRSIRKGRYKKNTSTGRWNLIVPEGVEEIRDTARNGGFSWETIYYPKSLKKISVNYISPNVSTEHIFNGKIPDLVGDRKSKSYRSWLGTLYSDEETVSWRLQVQKGEKKKWMENLLTGVAMTEKQEKRIRKYMQNNIRE